MKKTVLQSLLEVAPAGWAFVRAVEYNLLVNEAFRPKVLDVGCGDGIFTKIFLKGLGRKNFDVGLDASEKELSKVRKTGCYQKAVLSLASKIPFPDGYFSTVFSNGTLEHISDIDATLGEISRVLKKSGRLIFTVPSSYFTGYLTFALVPLYAKIFNRLFGHLNLFNHKKWENMLLKNDMKIVSFAYYNSRKMVRIHELLTIFGFGAFLSKAVFGKWILFPKMRRLTARIEAKTFGGYLDSSISKTEGGSLFIIAEKK